MKKLLYILIIAFAFVFTGCGDKDTEGISSLVYLTKIELTGGDILVWEFGEPFVDPGFTATDNGVEVNETVEVSGLEDVDTGAEGLYEVKYSAVSKDGFASSVVRKVIVVEGEVSDIDLTGGYNGYSSSYGAFPPTKEVCKITKLAPGVFEATDFFCGHYTEGRKIGGAYVMYALFKLNTDNTYTVFENDTPWGPWIISNGVYDPTIKKMTHTITHPSGFSFDGALTLIPEED
ncbi:DUF5012 domain-containing protein [Labilibacter sediminis]|nr:DUF5012 domain-containing protein [Labilibacter sediminis]